MWRSLFVGIGKVYINETSDLVFREAESSGAIDVFIRLFNASTQEPSGNYDSNVSPTSHGKIISILQSYVLYFITAQVDEVNGLLYTLNSSIRAHCYCFGTINKTPTQFRPGQTEDKIIGQHMTKTSKVYLTTTCKIRKSTLQAPAWAHHAVLKNLVLLS